MPMAESFKSCLKNNSLVSVRLFRARFAETSAMWKNFTSKRNPAWSGLLEFLFCSWVQDSVKVRSLTTWMAYLMDINKPSTSVPQEAAHF